MIISKAQKDIEEKIEKIINDTIKVLGEFQKDLSQRLYTDVSNPALIQLKSVSNKMAHNLENINNVLKLLMNILNISN